MSYEKDDGTWDGTLWLGEKLSFPEEYMRTLKLIDGMYISKSSDLYQAIHNIVIRLIDIEMDAEYFTQLYQEGQIDYQQLRKDGDEAYQEVEILQKEIIDNLIKYKDQCLTREEAYAIE